MSRPQAEAEVLIDDDQVRVTRFVFAPGAAYRRDKGVEHNVINNGTQAMSFVELELK